MVCIFIVGLGADSDDVTPMLNVTSIHNKNYEVFYRIGNYLKRDQITIHATVLCTYTQINARFRTCKQSSRNDM